jgi:DNA-3-methyladenine glycosylase I
MQRCNWGNVSEKMIHYHDEEWGVPVHDDKTHFEYLMLEVLQCGLSWTLMIEKREIFRACFDDFDYEKIAKYTEQDVERILAYPGMIKSAGKVKAIISNASCFMSVRDEFGNFDNYLWKHSGGKTILYMGHQKGNIPAQNGLSGKISKDLKKRGFKYLGPVVVYSHLQACGIINDHTEDCFRYGVINEMTETVRKRRDNEK